MIRSTSAIDNAANPAGLGNAIPLTDTWHVPVVAQCPVTGPWRLDFGVTGEMQPH